MRRERIPPKSRDIGLRLPQAVGLQPLPCLAPLDLARDSRATFTRSVSFGELKKRKRKNRSRPVNRKRQQVARWRFLFSALSRNDLRRWRRLFKSLAFVTVYPGFGRNLQGSDRTPKKRSTESRNLHLTAPRQLTARSGPTPG